MKILAILQNQWFKDPEGIKAIYEERSKMIEPGIYKHHKGKLYSVIGTVRHSETGEILVLYIPLYEVTESDTVPTQMSVRPIELFYDKFRKVN